MLGWVGLGWVGYGRDGLGRVGLVGVRAAKAVLSPGGLVGPRLVSYHPSCGGAPAQAPRAVEPQARRRPPYLKEAHERKAAGDGGQLCHRPQLLALLLQLSPVLLRKVGPQLLRKQVRCGARIRLGPATQLRLPGPLLGRQGAVGGSRLPAWGWVGEGRGTALRASGEGATVAAPPRAGAVSESGGWARGGRRMTHGGFLSDAACTWRGHPVF